ncbi:hypothetical protein HPB49_023194 [Dermacentor silvarum]|uniref:Uncharacterized protein n=1 Tax=Dermacentor silvarum TaxID=543639 RepID=A0ACB8D067_DERSI|nr:hypothetical protein HPB49_023194 [Dermacentor silvarum]
MDVAQHGGARAAQLKRKLLKAGRMPRLHKEEAKVIVRPRGSFNISRMGAPVIANALVRAAGIAESESEGDTICPNWQQHIVVVSTPKREHATLKTQKVGQGGGLEWHRGTTRQPWVLRPSGPGHSGGPAGRAHWSRGQATIPRALQIPGQIPLQTAAERALPIQGELDFRTQRQRAEPGAAPGGPPPRRRSDNWHNMGRPHQATGPNKVVTLACIELLMMAVELSRTGRQGTNATQYLRTHERKPSVTLLQETLTEHIKIQSYRTHSLLYPPRPAHLPELNAVEERLTSPRMPFMSIRRLTRATGQYGIRGQVVKVPIEVPEVVLQLPRRVPEDAAIDVNIKRRRLSPATYRRVLPGEIDLHDRKEVSKAQHAMEKTVVYDDEGMHLEDASSVGHKLADGSYTVDVAPGENVRPLSLYVHTHGEELSYPTIWATPFVVSSSEIRRTDRRGVTPEHVLYMAVKVMWFNVHDTTMTFRTNSFTDSITREQLEKGGQQFLDDLGKPHAFLTLSASEDFTPSTSMLPLNCVIDMTSHRATRHKHMARETLDVLSEPCLSIQVTPSPDNLFIV